MEYQVVLRERNIKYSVSSSEPNLLDKLAFIHLVMMKFGGEEVSAISIKKDEELHYFIEVKFTDFEACSHAQSHCQRNLSPDGNIVEDYRGALDRADPHRMMARQMKAQAESGKSAN